MSLFLETPWPAIVLGVVAEALLGVAFYHTAHPRLPWAMAGVLGGVLLLALVEWLVVTEHEAVSNMLEGVADALETNDIEQVLAHLAPEGDRIRHDAQHYLPNIEVSDANIGGDLKVTVNRLTSPPTARATFTGRITGKNRSPGETVPYDNFIRRFTLRLRQEEDRWLLTDYELAGDPRPR